MEKHELMLGGVRAVVELPETLPVDQVSVTFRPKTREEFEQVVAAVGGIERLRMPKRMSGYYDEPAYVDVARVDGVRALGVIYPPPSSEAEAGVAPAPHPFFGEYVERQSS